MAQPCEQENNITHIQRTLDRMEETQRQLVDVLQQVANHTVRVDNLEDKSEQTHHDMNVLYDRVRMLELDGSKLTTLLNIASNKYFVAGIISLGSMTLIGAGLDLMYHYETVRKIFSFLK